MPVSHASVTPSSEAKGSEITCSNRFVLGLINSHQEGGGVGVGVGVGIGCISEERSRFQKDYSNVYCGLGLHCGFS